jgi:hypothetical protein
MSRAAVLALAAGVFLLVACLKPSPLRYRLSHSGTHWDTAGRDRVLEDLRPRYPEFFEVALDPSVTQDLDLRRIRTDLEQQPVDRHNFDALNSVAIVYFELNYRAEEDRGGAHYLANSFRAAKILALPWKAYGEVPDARLRDAILDFFEDVTSGEKLHSAGTRSRLASIVASLESKEDDPARRERIRALVGRLEALRPPA